MLKLPSLSYTLLLFLKLYIWGITIYSKSIFLFVKSSTLTIVFILASICSFGQDYFYQGQKPFISNIPTPEEFLGYPIGTHHTRHDQIVAYFERLAALSNRANISYYGETYEHRKLIMLTISSANNLGRMDTIKKDHLKLCEPSGRLPDIANLPIFVQLGYNVHGNEPSGAEAAILTAYVLVASNNPQITDYLNKAVFFIDPVINPDGRDRHSHWANMYKGDPVVADPRDVEHNEAWPRGRTNHYWFDLNRDWWLGVHPESQGKLKWYHEWYPNVVTDFHEMGTHSTHFFEPMKTNGSKYPIMPQENYTTLNETFAQYFAEGLDSIGSLYFTKEVFDGTYPGYGSSYPDLQGGLGLLFEQASSRGHAQETPMGELTFAFTVRNQYVSTLATIKASVEQKDLLHRYQKDFFTSAITNARRSPVRAYVYGADDMNRLKAFTDKLLLHKVKVYGIDSDQTIQGKLYKAGKAFVVPTEQAQYRIVQSAFETYSEYHDSVFYDASAWSLVNFYNMQYSPVSRSLSLSDEITSTVYMSLSTALEPAKVAYLAHGDDYNIPAFIHHLQASKVRVNCMFKPFSLNTNYGRESFEEGSIMIQVAKQDMNNDQLFKIIQEASSTFNIKVSSAQSGYATSGIDLGSRYAQTVHKPKVVLIIGDGVSSYEAGEVWHLMDQRVHMPITKVDQHQFKRLDLSKYNTLMLVSGSYTHFDSAQVHRIKQWVSAGNTLITSREGSVWAIKKKLVKEKLIEASKTKDSVSLTTRGQYAKAPEEIGRDQVGGSIFETILDLTHPLAFGYSRANLPVYRNSEVWLAPSQNKYSNVAMYSDSPHLDGFISEKNMDQFLKKSVSLLVSKVGSGRAIMFAENPNFRGCWYGTNRLFLNAVFLGNHIRIPN